MLCDNCKERDAIINLTQVEHDSKVTLHLCEQCAQHKGVETGGAVLKTPARRVSSGAIGKGAANLRADAAPTACAARPAAARCGTSAIPGRLGCDRVLRRLRRRICGTCCGGCTAPASTWASVTTPPGEAGAATRSRQPAARPQGRSCGARSRAKTSSSQPTCGTASGCSNDGPLAAARRRHALAGRLRSQVDDRAVDPHPARPERARHRRSASGPRTATGRRCWTRVAKRPASTEHLCVGGGASVWIRWSGQTGSCCTNATSSARSWRAGARSRGRAPGAALLVQDQVGVMVNEEDHLRLARDVVRVRSGGRVCRGGIGRCRIR